MKFAGKYETLQKVAIGPVETFVARDRASNQKVIVHTFECPEQATSQSTMQGVLSTFSALAPQPLASIIDAGKFDGTSFAYLVTNWPGDEAVGKWVRLYQEKLEGKGTSEPLGAATVIFGSGPTSPPTTLPKARLDEGPQSATAAVPGAISGFFQQPEDTTPQNPADAVPEAPREFTKQFFSLSADEPTDSG